MGIVRAYGVEIRGTTAIRRGGLSKVEKTDQGVA